MERPIKFRAWDREAKTMLTVRDINFLGEEIDTYEWEGDWLGFDHVVLMQFTGLKDKNGVKIYEGDVLKTDLSRPYVVVVFRNGAFMYQCHDSGEDYYDLMDTVNEEASWSRLEVIGNRWEHPELLEMEVDANV